MKHLKLSLAAVSVLVNCSVFAQTADEVLTKHIEAIGGTKAWNKVKTIKMTGSTDAMGQSIDMTTTIINGKSARTDFSIAGQKNYMIVSKTGGWSFLPVMGQTEPMAIPAEDVKTVADEYDYTGAQVASKALIASATMDGTDTIDSKPCLKLKVTDKAGNVKECYFDAATYYLVKSETTVKTPDGEQQMATSYSNHKKLPEGIVVPMTVSRAQGDMTIKSFEVNKAVDEKIFAPAKK
jgi:hypothetical protein